VKIKRWEEDVLGLLEGIGRLGIQVVWLFDSMYMSVRVVIAIGLRD
jgi:hypothetical protein